MATAKKSARKTVKRTGVSETAYVRRPSQITRKTPTKRLVKRRVKKVAAPKATEGFFPNPVEARYKKQLDKTQKFTKGYVVGEIDAYGNIGFTAFFSSKNLAVQFAQQLADISKSQWGVKPGEFASELLLK